MVNGRYENWSELREAWDQRDVRCRRRLEPLTDAEVESMRSNRKAEIGLLPPDDRAEAFRALIKWQPPRAIEAFDDHRRSPVIRVA